MLLVQSLNLRRCNVDLVESLVWDYEHHPSAELAMMRLQKAKGLSPTAMARNLSGSFGWTTTLKSFSKPGGADGDCNGVLAVLLRAGLARKKTCKHNSISVSCDFHHQAVTMSGMDFFHCARLALLSPSAPTITFLFLDFLLESCIPCRLMSEGLSKSTVKGTGTSFAVEGGTIHPHQALIGVGKSYFMDCGDTTSTGCLRKSLP